MQLQQHRSSHGSSSSSNSATSTRPQHLSLACAAVALVVGLLPTQLFFAFLFYTDVPSLLFLLLTELLLLRRSTYAAAAAGAAAIGMRQTNAVWVTFLTGAAVLRDVLQQQPAPSASKARAEGSASSKRKQEQRQQHHGGVLSPLHELWSLLQSVWGLRVELLQAYWLLLLLPAVFIAFVLWNGGITLGDRDAHAPTLHLMQPLYFALFSLVSAGPLLLQPAVLSHVRKAVAGAPVLCVLVTLSAGAAAALCMQRFSLVHPYLLADNRHYTFYLWRRVFARSELVRLAAVPGYVGGWALLLAGLSAAGEHWLWCAGFAVSCWVSLAPAWLVEFRCGSWLSHAARARDVTQLLATCVKHHQEAFGLQPANQQLVANALCMNDRQSDCASTLP
jgi:alpha-1,2-glucosyltransferase